MAKNYKNIYIKNQLMHHDYDDTILENTNIMDVVISKIQLLLFTNKGDVLSDPDMGCDIEKLLWETNVNDDFIEQEVNIQIITYVPEAKQYNYEVNFYIVPGTTPGQDVGILEVDLDFTTIRSVYK